MITADWLWAYHHPTPNSRKTTCRRAGCNQPATTPDLNAPEGDQGWCAQHLLEVRVSRVRAQQEAHRYDARFAVNGRIVPVQTTVVRQHAQCGTRAGYMQHRARLEEPCGECRSANTEYQAQRRAVS